MADGAPAGVALVRRPEAESFVPAPQPTIVATSIGFQPDGPDQWNLRPGPAYSLATTLAGAGKHPRLCIIATAVGENPAWLTAMHHAFSKLDMVVSHLNLFPMPNVDDIEDHLSRQDVIWVSGGSTANLLALWRLHGLDRYLRQPGRRASCSWASRPGPSAGTWVGRPIRSGLPLQPITDALGFLPYSNSPHHDAEPERRPLIHRLIGDGTLPAGYATDNGAGLIYHGTDLHEAVTEKPGALAYEIQRQGDGARETRCPPGSSEIAGPGQAPWLIRPLSASRASDMLTTADPGHGGQPFAAAFRPAIPR